MRTAVIATAGVLQGLNKVESAAELCAQLLVLEAARFLETGDGVEKARIAGRIRELAELMTEDMAPAVFPMEPEAAPTLAEPVIAGTPVSLAEVLKRRGIGG